MKLEGVQVVRGIAACMVVICYIYKDGRDYRAAFCKKINFFLRMFLIYNILNSYEGI